MNRQTTTVGDLELRIRAFAEARAWGKFHTPRNLILALVGETGELAAEFQWLGVGQDERVEISEGKLAAIGAELADVLTYLIRLADVLEIDLVEQVLAKLLLNEERYPVHLASGSSIKYTELGRERG